MTTIETSVRESARGNAADAAVLTRVSFSFSPTGTRAVCLAAHKENDWQLETWSFDGPSPRRQLLSGMVSPSDQLIPFDDGRVLLCRNRGGTHEIVLLTPQVSHTPPAHERILAVVHSRGLRVLPSPEAGLLGVAIATDERGCSTLWRVSLQEPCMERVTELSGLLLGGVWMDSTGMLLGVDRSPEEGGPAKGAAIDLRDGSCIPMLDVTKASNDRLLLCHPRSGLLLVSTDAPGEDRLGWCRLGKPEPVRFPDTLRRPSQAVHPLTFDPDGERVLLHFDEGVRSRLAVYTPAIDRLVSVEFPPGRIRGMACWTGEVVRFPFSSPTKPTSVVTARIKGTTDWSILDEPKEASLLMGRFGRTPPSSADGTHWQQAHIEQLEGVTGPIEAIVYGGQNWRASQHLVLALHGGPMAAWRFEFQPLFQRLAAAGIAIVAPNQRGSSGYGAAHTLAIRGAWGGPDLDDVCCIARALVAERHAAGEKELAVLGVSYGAFLALLAASCEPNLWSHCVALAPFLSGTRLYHEASPRVRMLLDQLRGCQELRDDLGPRDVLRLCPEIRARLLVAHGDQDSVIPVGQSRMLRHRLLELGRGEGTDFQYLEIPGGRHDLLNVGGNAFHQQIVRFLLPACTDLVP